MDILQAILQGQVSPDGLPQFAAPPEGAMPPMMAGMGQQTDQSALLQALMAILGQNGGMM